MRHANAEIMKANTFEEGSLKKMLVEAKQEVMEISLDAQEAEEDTRSLELELIEAQAAAERRAEAEEKGKETKEKITELTG